MNSTYFTLGLAALVLQIVVYRRSFPLRGYRMWIHFFSAGVALVCMASLVGLLAALPLRAALE